MGRLSTGGTSEGAAHGDVVGGWEGRRGSRRGGRRWTRMPAGRRWVLGMRKGTSSCVVPVDNAKSVLALCSMISVGVHGLMAVGARQRSDRGVIHGEVEVATQQDQWAE